MRRTLLWIVGIMVLGGALGFALLETESRVDADEYEKVRSLQTKLEARGYEVGSIEIRGDRVTILRTPSAEYGVEQELAKWAAYRAAAEEGYSWIDFGTVGSEPTEGLRLRLQEVPQADPARAAELVTAWVAEVKERTGAKIEATYADYRLDLTVEASREVATSVAEQFMMGGVLQHEAGALDILTILIRSDGEVLFEGVGDFVVGVQARVYVAPDLSLGW